MTAFSRHGNLNGRGPAATDGSFYVPTSGELRISEGSAKSVWDQVAYHMSSSVVHPDAVVQTKGDYRVMVCAENLPKGFTESSARATVGDVMSRGVISCPPETPLRVIARMMTTSRVHAIFVFEHGNERDEAQPLWAVVSDLDLVAATQLDLDTLTAGESAVTPLVSVLADASIAEAGGLMAQYGIAHLAVTEPGSKRPIGVISTLDIARAVAAA